MVKLFAKAIACILLMSISGLIGQWLIRRLIKINGPEEAVFPIYVSFVVVAGFIAGLAFWWGYAQAKSFYEPMIERARENGRSAGKLEATRQKTLSHDHLHLCPRPRTG